MGGFEYEPYSLHISSKEDFFDVFLSTTDNNYEEKFIPDSLLEEFRTVNKMKRISNYGSLELEDDAEEIQRILEIPLRNIDTDPFLKITGRGTLLFAVEDSDISIVISEWGLPQEGEMK